jgi:hypothetical protein
MLMSLRRWIAGMTIVSAMAGCDRPPAQSVPAPTTVPAPAATTTASAASTQPLNSLININGHSTAFPPARMRLETDGQHLVALVFSDDPKDALKDNYTGNSFYLRMELDVDSTEKLADANWHYTAPSSGDREDSPYGIYLGGKKIQLQPYDVMGRFKITDGGTAVLLSGQFQVVEEATTRGPPQLVPVGADVPVRIEAETAKGK